MSNDDNNSSGNGGGGDQETVDERPDPTIEPPDYEHAVEGYEPDETKDDGRGENN